MKNLQTKLFIVLALGLCGLCAYQWNFETTQRAAIGRLDQDIYQKAIDIQGYTNSLRDMDNEIAQLQGRVTQLKHAAVTNEQALVLSRRETARLRSSSELLANEIAEYKSAVNKLEASLTNAYDGIKKQNAAMKEIVGQRDEFVQKYNDSIKDRNDVVVKYNDVVERLNKLQAAAAAAK